MRGPAWFITVRMLIPQACITSAPTALKLPRDRARFEMILAAGRLGEACEFQCEYILQQARSWRPTFSRFSFSSSDSFFSKPEKRSFASLRFEW